MKINKKIIINGSVRYLERNMAYISNSNQPLHFGDSDNSKDCFIQCLDINDNSLIWSRKFHGLYVVYDEFEEFLILTNYYHESIGVIWKQTGDLLWSVNTKISFFCRAAFECFPKLFNFYDGPYCIYNKNLLTREGYLLEISTGKKLDKLSIEKSSFKIDEYTTEYGINKINGEEIDYKKKRNINAKNFVLIENLSFEDLKRIGDMYSLEPASTQFKNSLIWNNKIYVLMKNKNTSNKWIQISHYFLVLNSLDYSINFKYELGEYLNAAFTFFDGNQLLVECQDEINYMKESEQRLLYVFSLGTD